jgi:hypothetical protein
MKISATFQTEPNLNIYNDCNFDIITGDQILNVSAHEYYKYLKNDPTKKVVPEPKFSVDAYTKLHQCLAGKEFSSEEWQELLMYRFYDNFISCFTDEELPDCKLPITRIKGNQTLNFFKQRKNKMLVFSTGVMVFQYLYSQGDITLVNAMYNALQRNGVDIVINKNDFELKGKKIAGFLDGDVFGNKMYSEGILTFNYDDKIFKNLPAKYYSRTYQGNKKEGEQSITGILNEYPNADINKILTDFLNIIKYRK